jgi:hypothetical protein
MTMTDTQKQPEPADAVPALLEGSFALFENDGGYLVAWRRRGDDETRHLSIPAFVLTMAANATGQTPDQVVAQLMGLSK